MKNVNLSFIIATRDRLPFLRITLEILIKELQDDEEIVVVDGYSTDGAKEYLQQLFEQRKIHQFISEPDRNQAHGWNKALLMAKGAVIKKIIDDDVHSYTAIRQCKKFMLNNPQVDICLSNSMLTSLKYPHNILQADELKNYQAWANGDNACFSFSDVYIMIRKNALSYLGLYDTSFTMMDWEYSLRCSFLKANIAYYTGYNAILVSTPGNVSSSVKFGQLKRERRIGIQKYGYKGSDMDFSFYYKIKATLYKLYQKRFKRVKNAEVLSAPNLLTTYNKLYKYLAECNEPDDFSFIFNTKTN